MDKDAIRKRFKQAVKKCQPFESGLNLVPFVSYDSVVDFAVCEVERATKDLNRLLDKYLADAHKLAAIQAENEKLRKVAELSSLLLERAYYSDVYEFHKEQLERALAKVSK